jgi:hypothetical protein
MSMPCVIWAVNGKEYRLRLTTFNSIQVEKQLGMGMTEAVNRLMDSTVIITILWGALQPYNHGMNFREVCDLYDEYIAAGGSAEKIVDVILKLLAQVGIGDTESTEKNAVSQAEAPLTEA